MHYMVVTESSNKITPKHTSRDVQRDLEERLPRRVLPWPLLKMLGCFKKKSGERKVKKSHKRFSYHNQDDRSQAALMLKTVIQNN